MKAMILAAGRGERMRPLTDHTPKPLLKVGGKPLIVWHLEHLAQAGFKEVVINHAHLGEQIEHYLGNGNAWRLNIQYSPEKIALETAGGIANALPFLTEKGKKIEPFLVVNGDVFTEINFEHLQLAQADLAHLVLVENPLQHPEGDFALEPDLLKNKAYLKNDGNKKFTFSGVGVYHPHLFQKIKRGEAAKLAPLLREAITQKKVSAEFFNGVWHDIGTPERLDVLDKLLKNDLNQRK